MPEIICTTVYYFPELSDAAKEKARSWYKLNNLPQFTLCAAHSALRNATTATNHTPA